MASAPFQGIRHKVVDALLGGFAGPIAVIALFGLLIARGRPAASLAQIVGS